MERGAQLDQAIVPTQATRPGAQVWKVSTAGDESSTWLWATVNKGRAAVAEGRRDGVCYFEWSCPDDLDPCSPSSWERFHPAYGLTIGVAQMHAALEQLGPTGFARAYGNRWPEGMGETAAPRIPPGRWAAVQVPATKTPLSRGTRLAFGFDVARDRSAGTIVVAWRDLGGLRCEIADTRPGTGWLAERMAELAQTWRPVGIGYDAGGPALDIADTLATSGLAVGPIGGRDWTAACSGWLAAIVDRRIRVGSHPAMATAASRAPGRDSGDGGWRWHRRGIEVSIAPVVAATAACWALDHPTAPVVASWTAF